MLFAARNARRLQQLISASGTAQVWRLCLEMVALGDFNDAVYVRQLWDVHLKSTCGPWQITTRGSLDAHIILTQHSQDCHGMSADVTMRGGCYPCSLSGHLVTAAD